MRKVFEALLCLTCMIAIYACGSKRPPTGGPIDTEKPVVIASVPEKYGDISSGKIEISFSKALDKSSIASAIYIYPPVGNKKISYDANTIKIRLLEKLNQNTNYFVTLTTRLKDTRGNTLEKNETIVYRVGELNDYRISGNIIYEDEADIGQAIKLNLLSADSLMIMSTEIKGNSFAISGLNPAEHIIRAYIDKNQNGRYDFSREPYFESRSPSKALSNIDINLSYADTTMVQIKSIRAVSNREVEVVFSETLKSHGEFSIYRLSDNKALAISIKNHLNDKLHLITAEQDTSRYQLIIENLRDPKGNLTKRAGIQFNGSNRTDTSPPVVISASPRNGTSVNDLSPIIEIGFNKIMPKERVKYSLLSSDRKEQYPLILLTGDSKTYRFQPEKPLQNYRSYLFVISKDTSDIFGNNLKEDYELSFLPLYRESSP